MKASSQLHFFSRVYLKTPNVPGQWVFLRCAASFFLEIRQYSCGKCLSQRKNPSLPVTSCVFRYTLKNQRGPSFFQKGPRLLLSGISLLSLCVFAFRRRGFLLLCMCCQETLDGCNLHGSLLGRGSAVAFALGHAGVQTDRLVDIWRKQRREPLQLRQR